MWFTKKIGLAAKQQLHGQHGNTSVNDKQNYKKLSYCWETVRRESMPRIAEMDVEMTA